MSHIIEEYRTLREEIVRLEKEQLVISFYVLTVSIAAAGLAGKLSVFIIIIPIVYLIIIIWGLERYYISSNLRVRLSSYIKVMLEPNINGINWETNNLKFKQNKKLIQNINFRRITNLFTLLLVLDIYIIAQYISAIMIYGVDLLEIFEIIVIGLLFISRLYYLRKAVFRYPKMEDYIKRWENIKSET